MKVLLTTLLNMDLRQFSVEIGPQQKIGFYSSPNTRVNMLTYSPSMSISAAL